MTLRDLAERYSALEAVDKSDFQRSARILQFLHFDKEEAWLDSAKASGSGRRQGGKE